MLAPMQYRDFVWPNNPRVFEVKYRRTLHSYKLPFSGYVVQNLGLQNKIIRGEGEFVGPQAYENFRKLAALFEENKGGKLVHPVWPTMRAYFASLSLKQEPKEDYISYSFEFWECEEQSGYTQNELDPDKSKYISAQENDTLALIATRYSKQLADLIRINPQVKNPDSIVKGQIIRIS